MVPRCHSETVITTLDGPGWRYPISSPNSSPQSRSCGGSAPHHRGKGYATEAASTALRWGFDDLGLDEIVSVYEPDNVPSGRVMDRLGFGAGVAMTPPTIRP